VFVGGFIGCEFFAIPLLLFLSFLAPLLFGAEDTTSSRLVGTWVWAAHRHDCTVTYNADGTYKAINDRTTINGTWKIEGDQLIETQKGDLRLSVTRSPRCLLIIAFPPWRVVKLSFLNSLKPINRIAA